MAAEKRGSGQGFWLDGLAQGPEGEAGRARVLLDPNERPWLIVKCYGPYGLSKARPLLTLDQAGTMD